MGLSSKLYRGNNGTGAGFHWSRVPETAQADEGEKKAQEFEYDSSDT